VITVDAQESLGIGTKEVTRAHCVALLCCFIGMKVYLKSITFMNELCVLEMYHFYERVMGSLELTWERLSTDTIGIKYVDCLHLCSVIPFAYFTSMSS
jgi:hypothetical protein